MMAPAVLDVMNFRNSYMCTPRDQRRDEAFYFVNQTVQTCGHAGQH